MERPRYDKDNKKGSKFSENEQVFEDDADLEESLKKMSK